MKKIAFFLFNFIVVLSCKKTKSISENIEIIKVPPIALPTGKPELKLSSVIDSSYTVRLETKEVCIIGHVDKVVVHDDRIYVLDKYRSKGVFEFTLDGTFVRKFGKRGKGPGEYTHLAGLAMDDHKKHLILYDRGKRALLEYNLKGEFLGTKKIKASFSEFFITDSGYIANIHNVRQVKNDTKREFSIASIDNEGKVASTFLKATHKIGNLVSSNCLINTGNGLFYKKPNTNLIYKIEQNNAIPTFKIEFEDKEIPEDFFRKYENSKNVQSFYDEIETKEYAIARGAYTITNDVLLFSVNKGRYGYKCLYSLKSKKLYPINGMDNNTESIGLLGSLVGSHHNFIVNYTQPDWILPMAEHTKSEKIKQFLKETNPNDNPILIFNRFRDGL